jgi:hypothetical protein
MRKDFPDEDNMHYHQSNYLVSLVGIMVSVTAIRPNVR